jgi:hypothetical protein
MKFTVSELLALAVMVNCDGELFVTKNVFPVAVASRTVQK